MEVINNLADKHNFAVSPSKTLYQGMPASIPKSSVQQTKNIGGKGWEAVKTELGNKEALAILPEGTNLAEAMHEVEHIKNDSGANGKLRKAISTISVGNKSGGHSIEMNQQSTILGSGLGNKNTRKETLDYLVNNGQLTSKDAEVMENSLETRGIGKSIKNFVRGKARISEERAATRRGLREAKKTGLLSPEELSAQEYVMRNGGDSYVPGTKITNKIPLRNLIQIPSRRGDFGEHVYRNLK